MLAEESRSHHADRPRNGTARLGTLIVWLYEGRLLTERVRPRQRPNVRRALASLLAGDVYDDDNLLVRTGVLASAAQ